MILASCDIETTGLNPETHQVLEIAVILWDSLDLTSPVEDLPTFHCYVENGLVQGDAFALSMHPVTLRRIANREEGFNYYRPELVADRLRSWCMGQEMGIVDGEGRPKLCFTGKNFGSFDLQFLRRLPGWNGAIRAVHRQLDPGTLFFRPSDHQIPSMDECCERAGIDLTTNHDAVGDAQLVIKLLRSKLRGTL